MSRILYIDYENVQSVAIERIADTDFNVWVFTGLSQTRIPIEFVRSAQAFGNRLHWVMIDGNGPNALDFHIAYYLGLQCAARPKDEYFILSKDKGFDPLIKHVTKGGVRCQRISSISDLEPSPRASARPKKTTEPDAAFARISKNLANMQETKRPRNRRALRQHVKTLAGRVQTEQRIDALVAQLFAAKVVMEGDRGLVYKF